MPPVPLRARTPHGARLLGPVVGAAVALLALAGVAPARQTVEVPEAIARIGVPAIDAHLRFLSHDLLGGRAPGSRGARVAALYLESAFRRLGLSPLGGSFLQPVPLVGRTVDREALSAEFAAGAATLRASYPEDVVLWTNGVDAARLAAEVVFVGYGIHAPEHGWDDFAGADLRGKLLLVLAGEPPPTPEAPARFDGRALTYYGRWSYKFEEAARRGAAGALIVHTREGAGYAWSVVQNSWTGELLQLRGGVPGPVVEGWVTDAFATQLLRAAGLELGELVARAGRPDFRPVPTGIAARLDVRSASRAIDATNVAGLLPGSDPELRDEVVVFTAHFDGLGVGPPVAGDSIYNGAYDNASGVAALLEIAHAFASLDERPERSILFLATTAEEAGQLGARHYVRSPLIPLARTVAAINIDGASIWGETEDMTVIGAARSSALGAIAASAASALGVRLVPDRAPELGRFFRSDQIAFALAGIPAVQVEHGVEFRGRPLAWGAEVIRRYSEEDYHRPSDEYDPAFDLSGAVQQARFAFLMGYLAATSGLRAEPVPVAPTGADAP